MAKAPGCGPGDRWFESNPSLTMENTIDLGKEIFVVHEGPDMRFAVGLRSERYSRATYDFSSLIEAYRQLFEESPRIKLEHGKMLAFILGLEKWLASFDGDVDRKYQEALGKEFEVSGLLRDLGFSLADQLATEQANGHWYRGKGMVAGIESEIKTDNGFPYRAPDDLLPEELG